MPQIESLPLQHNDGFSMFPMRFRIEYISGSLSSSMRVQLYDIRNLSSDERSHEFPFWKKYFLIEGQQELAQMLQAALELYRPFVEGTPIQ